MPPVVPHEAALSPATSGLSCDNRGMDATDREILGELMRNGRVSYRDLGASVGLSANAAADRVRRMIRDGVITGFTATVDHGAAGRRLVALIDVRLVAAGTNEEFEAATAKLEPVVDAVHVTGRFDYQLRVACRDTAELDRLLRHLKRDGGASETETRVVLRSAFTRWAP
jgi:Lrp/AsnC family transcriptional regulator, leucine-responsive regulatory protein